ncbi:accessory factor UbiK family protein, partial [Rhizobium johnstonii]|uniref:accessory factor UbiK family protein n=1 Tax=Rhizobium johnstonii TaxID=3019933 RepID=UPI003F9654F4
RFKQHGFHRLRRFHSVPDNELECLKIGFAGVKREEFEAVSEMAVKARDEKEALAARIAALEAKIAGEGA